MNTIKIYLSESLSVADLRKDFPLYQGQYQSKLLNVFVPKSLLSANYDVQHYIGQMSSVGLPSNDTLNAFVITHTPTGREPQESDFIDVVATIDENIVLYRYTFTTEWTYEQVESFAINQMAGTSVKLGMVSTAPNGQVVKSKSYYMRYLKDLTYQNVEYALYERKLPKEFTTFSGVGENAPKMVINVVNVSTDGLATINDIICSQTCSFEVLPSSVLDRDESIEPSELETLTALVNELIVAYNDKQDKNSNLLNTTSKAIVGAINELKGQVDTNTSNIGIAQGDISDLEGDVAYIKEQMSTPEKYIGQMTGSSLPTQQQLTDFVESTIGEAPKNANVIIFIQTISGGTDKNYKYIYSASGWNGYEIPPMETASNGNAGIVQGTYNIGDTNNTLVDIVGGKIKEVYVNVNPNGVANYITLSYFVPTLQTAINDIISGETKVGYAEKADKDENGNAIASTYMTNVIGASKTYVKNYALPRTFNDIYYYSGDDNDSIYSKTNDSTLKSYDANISLGYTPLLTAIMTTDSVFQLSNKNSFENTFYLKDSSVLAQPNEHVLYVRVETSISQDNGTTYTPINVEVSNLITFTNTTDLVKVEIGGIFDLLGEGVINVQEGDLIKQEFSAYVESSNGIDKVSIYWGSNYPLRFNLNTQQVVFSSGLLGQEPIFANASSSNENIVVDGETKVAKIYYLPDAPQLNDGVEGFFVLTGNLQNVDYIGLRVGDSVTYEEFALKIPLNYYDNTLYVGLGDIEGLPIRKNNASNDQIVFKGFIRNNYVDKYILIDLADSVSEIISIGSSLSGTFTADELEKLQKTNTIIVDSSGRILRYLRLWSGTLYYSFFDGTTAGYHQVSIDTSTGNWTKTSGTISATNLNSTGATSGQVLASNGDGTASWQSPSGSFTHYVIITNTSGTLSQTDYDKLLFEDSVLIKNDGGLYYYCKKYTENDTTIVFRYLVHTNNNYRTFTITKATKMYAQSFVSVSVYDTNIKSGSATSGQVLQADGNGGASWQTPSASGPDVITLTGTAGTLSSSDLIKVKGDNCIILNSPNIYFKFRTTATYTHYCTYWISSSGGYIEGNIIRISNSTGAWTSQAGVAIAQNPEGIYIKSTYASSGQVLTADGNGNASWQNPSSPVIVDIGTAQIGNGVSLSSDVIAKLRDTTRNDVFVVFKVGNSFNAGYDSGTQFMLPRTLNFIDTQGQSSDATKFSGCIDATNNIYLDMDVDATGYFMSYYQHSGTTNYNELSNRPITNQDLDEVGFTAVANTYYRHTGTTSTYTNGVVYFYDGSNFNAVGGASGGVSDVLVNNASVVSNGVATIPQSYGSRFGVIRGIQCSDTGSDLIINCTKRTDNSNNYNVHIRPYDKNASNKLYLESNYGGTYGGVTIDFCSSSTNGNNRIYSTSATRPLKIGRTSSYIQDLPEYVGTIMSAGAWTSGTGGTLSLGTETGLFELKTTNTSGSWFLYRGDTTNVWTSNTVCYGSDILHYVKVTTDGVLHWFKHDIGTSTEEEVVNPITYRRIGIV